MARTRQEIMDAALQAAGTYHTASDELALITLEVLLDIRDALQHPIHFGYGAGGGGGGYSAGPGSSGPIPTGNAKTGQ